MEKGYIVSPYEGEPWTIPVKTFAGWRLQDCEGYVDFPAATSVLVAGGQPTVTATTTSSEKASLSPP